MSKYDPLWEYIKINAPWELSFNEVRQICGFSIDHSFLNCKNYCELEFSPAVETDIRHTADNPKRRQRNARKQLQHTGVGTKSQQALQMQLEHNKQERKVKSHNQKLAEKERLFELKQQEKKEKHRGEIE